MDANAAQVKLVIEDDAGERDQPVLWLDECDVHFRHLHVRHLFNLVPIDLRKEPDEAHEVACCLGGVKITDGDRAQAAKLLS